MMTTFNVCLSMGQSSSGLYGIRGRAVQSSRTPQGLRVLWCREAQPAMLKAVLAPEGFVPAIRQCSYAVLFLKRLWSYTILSCSLFSFYMPDLAALYGLQELPRPRFCTKPGNRLLLTATFPDSLCRGECLPLAALFQGLSMPPLFLPCRSGLSGQDTSPLYDVEKPALKSVLEVSIA